mmetsp:Transcript_5416/g.7833  ORF Transcript_5416/g.7833 Transcript_5416/m.7833 type:complete len:1444 (-) Transcript_5416:63-4394(-)
MVFQLMARMPWPFLFVLPVTFLVFIGIGFSQDDIVEKKVQNLWEPTRSDFVADKTVALKVREDNGVPVVGGSTGFSAMAIARDRGNLFEENRLNELRDRMEKVEATTVEHNGITFTWDDVCLQNSLGKGTVYKLPCFRYSVLDFFQEAQWSFTESRRVTWYNELVQKLLIKPLLGRFGIMNSFCSSASSNSQSVACDDVIASRTNKDFLPGLLKNPLLLLSDIRGMEMNDECRICIESQFEGKMNNLTTSYKTIFEILFTELRKLNNTDTDNASEIQDLLQKLPTIIENIDRTAVEEWYHYYVIRDLYSSLGAESYKDEFNTFVQDPQLNLACSVAKLLGRPVECPENNITLVDGIKHLQDHADNKFSSVITAGFPFPFWDEGDETGSFLAGQSPVGGSGIDMSGEVFSSAKYFGLSDGNTSTWYLDLFSKYNTSDWSPLYAGEKINISDPNWALVESDPILRWFIGSVTNMTSHCGNGNLTGSSGLPGVDESVILNEILFNVSKGRRWCTAYSIPFEEDGTKTQQFFVKMFYDLLVDSDEFLSIRQGDNDPYDWTTGNGCNYSLTGSRFSYTNMSEESILNESSTVLYNFEEGAALGAVDTRPLMASYPIAGEYNSDNPLKSVPVVQNIYPALTSTGLVERLRNCNRPGGPIEISKEDATQVITKFKEAFENNWAEGWDDRDSSEVQFVGFFDDIETSGTTGRILEELTLENGTLTTVSIILIAVVSGIFLFSFDLISSQVGVCMVGVALVIIAFFSAIGFGVLIGIKINVSIAWTLPFIILGLGVDDMYIVLLSFRNHRVVSKESFAKTMKEVLIPVTMTSLVNASVFAVMNVVDIPVIYKTAQVALISIIFLWMSIILCFPAYCYLDIKRQESNRYDVLVCVKKQINDTNRDSSRESFLFVCYKSLLLEKGARSKVLRVLVLLSSTALLALGVYGITERKVGFGLQDFFPSSSQAQTWAKETTQTIGSWSIALNWGAADYNDPDTQLFIMRQMEQVIETPHVVETDTIRLWLANFNVWTTRQCQANFDRSDANVLECGQDQVFPLDNSRCTGKWMRNTYNAREKIFAEKDKCLIFEGGVCRPSLQMHPEDLRDLGIDPENLGNETYSSWCPVFEGFTDAKLQFCLTRWHNFTGGGGNLIKVDNTKTPYSVCEGEFNDDADIVTPILLSEGPLMFAYDLKSDQDYLDMIKETRQFCDDVDRVQCWITGIPYNYWEQFLHIEEALLLASSVGVGIGFTVAFLFLFVMLTSEKEHSAVKVLGGSLLGSLLIALTILLSLVPVVGISVLAGVKITAFSVMSYLLSIGFVVEYSVHIVHRYMKAPNTLDSPVERVEYAMSFLSLPMFMAYVSSTLGVICLAFTEFEFNTVYFFIPLIIVMQVTFFFGCWFLPVILTLLNLQSLKFGSPAAEEDCKQNSNTELNELPRREVPRLDSGNSSNYEYDA